MRMEEQGHATRSKITVSIADTISSVHLRVSPKVTDSLYVDDDQLMSRTFKSEMAECLETMKTQVNFSEPPACQHPYIDEDSM